MMYFCIHVDVDSFHGGYIMYLIICSFSITKLFIQACNIIQTFWHKFASLNRAHTQVLRSDHYSTCGPNFRKTMVGQTNFPGIVVPWIKFFAGPWRNFLGVLEVSRSARTSMCMSLTILSCLHLLTRRHGLCPPLFHFAPSLPWSKWRPGMEC